MNFDRFLYERADAVLLDGTGLQPDPELMQRNLERARQIIERMGPKWCCYRPVNREANDD